MSSSTKKVVLCSVLLMMACAVFAVPAGASTQHPIFNVRIKLVAPLSSHPINKTEILVGCGCKFHLEQTHKAGQLVVDSGGEDVYLYLKPGEKVAHAYYIMRHRVTEEVGSEGESIERAHDEPPRAWYGNGTLPLESVACTPVRCEYSYLQRVEVFARLPHHQPYAKLLQAPALK